jgi:hypothetical protein
MSDGASLAHAVAWLRTPQAVRARCDALLALAERDALAHFVFDPDRLDRVVDYVLSVTRETYPDLAIPYHARWRHFAVGGIDRLGALVESRPRCDDGEIPRARFDLCVASVLLDAGAGAEWRYRESGTGLVLARSEGLAVASLHAFRAGLFSSDRTRPMQADADGLAAVTPARLAEALQVTNENPLPGLAGRAALMRALGTALLRRPDLFGTGPPRIGRLFDHFHERPGLTATEILGSLLDGFANIWPGRIALGGENLGDVWPHPLAGGTGPDAGLVPFHKLSQWLAYSLIEVLEDAGVPVRGLDALTGLAEYRNGGLLIDLGALRLRDPGLARAPLPPGHEAVVEWRALTVALLDRIAERLRARLGPDAPPMPLARVLEGGTWAAGRKIARSLRPDGAPPLVVLSDGTVF